MNIRSSPTGRRSTVLILMVIALFATPTVVAARDPLTGTGTGIDDSGGIAAGPTDLGYTSADALLKESAFQNSFTAQASPGAGTAASTPSSALVGGWVTYHQKTNYNCLPAIGQSILHQSFGGYTYPSVAGMQGTAAQQSGTIAAGMHTTTLGTNDYNALAYVNGRYAAEGSPWRYFASNNIDEPGFQFRITNEIGSLGHALYVRVDLTSTHYAWHQVKAAQHATAAVAYNGGGVSTTIADPFTHSISGGCSASWDSGAADVSCNWVNYSTNSYFLAKDVVRDGLQPLWF